MVGWVPGVAMMSSEVGGHAMSMRSTWGAAVWGFELVVEIVVMLVWL